MRPVITRTKMNVVKNRQFENFFENVTMSSYKVDPKTNLPILYLKDQKEALWQKFSEIYPDGMKRTSFNSFMVRLDNGPFRYREDLGGLCIICSEYGYQPFENLCMLVNIHISNKSVQVNYL